MENSNLPQNSIIGWWKLKSIYFEFDDNGERIDVYGSRPVGYVVITEDRRMMGLLMSGDRAPPQSDSDKARLFDSLMVYGGEVRLDEGIWSTTVDASWHPDWVGTEQVRHYEIEDGILSVTSATIAHPKFPGRKCKAIAKWHKV